MLEDAGTSATATPSSQSAACATSPSLYGDVPDQVRRRVLRDPGSRRLSHARCVRRRPRGRILARAAGATYEELHSRGGGISSTVRATRAAGEAGLPRRGRTAPLLDASRGHDDLRGQVRLRARSRDGAGLAPRDPGGGRRPDLARRPCVPPEFGDADAYLDFALARPAGSGNARGSCGRVPRARRRHPPGAGAALPRGVPRRRPRAAAPRRPVHRVRCDSPRRRARRPARSTISRRRARTGSARSRRATSSACSCRRARSSSTGRCRRRERSSTPAPRSRSPPTSTRAAPSARACRSSARSRRRSCICRRRRRSAACTVNAAHVLGRADRIGRLAPGYRADVTLLDAPDWRYLAYHLGGRVVARVVVGGELG